MIFVRRLFGGPSISQHTILILSGFLVGFSLAGFVSIDLRRYVMNCGAVGLIAFLGLYVAARSRKETVEQQLREKHDAEVRRVLSEYLGDIASVLETRRQRTRQGNSLDCDGSPLARLDQPPGDGDGATASSVFQVRAKE